MYFESTKSLSMKKLLIYLSLAITLGACTKEEEFKPDTFPGYSGSGEFATWALYSYAIVDSAYLGSYLASLTPPSTVPAYRTALNAARYKEATAFSVRLYRDGTVATITKDAQGKSVWTKRTDLKWEESGDFMYVKSNGQVVIEATPDLEKVIFKFRRAWYGDASANKDNNVIETRYTIYSIN
jgi:hypothetical protein